MQVLDASVRRPYPTCRRSVAAPGPPREKPERLQGDTGYDSEPVRQLLRWLGITPIMGERRCREHGSGLGVYRWFVELDDRLVA